MLDSLLNLTELNHIELFAMWMVVVIAAVIRGYAGFGFSAIVVAGLSLVTPTKETVPLVILMEVVASVQMFPKVWKDINWRMVAWILAGGIIFIPLRQAILKHVAIEPMRVICALALLIGVTFIAKGVVFNLNHRQGWAIIGVISGFANGLLAMGGMWVTILLLGSTIKKQVLRASLTAVFFGTDIYAGVTASFHGIMTMAIFWRALVAAPFLFVGIWLGSRKFEGTSDQAYRQVVLIVLTLLALMLIVRAIWTLA